MVIDSSAGRPSCRGTGSRLLIEYFAVGVFVEADYECLANSQGRSSKIAGWTKHISEKRFLVGRVFLQIDPDSLSAFTGIELVCIFRKLERVMSCQSGLLRVYSCCSSQLFAPKKLLGPGARSSTGTVINPI